MLRISWPFALLLAVLIAVVARRPRLLVPMLIVLAVWYAWERSKVRRKR